MQKEWLKVISMLVAMKTKDNLKRCAIMFVNKKFGVACCTVYHLWERAKSMCELGVISSPEFSSCKENSARRVITGFYPKLKSFVSCSHMNCCLQK